MQTFSRTHLITAGAVIAALVAIAVAFVAQSPPNVAELGTASTGQVRTPDGRSPAAPKLETDRRGGTSSGRGGAPTASRPAAAPPKPGTDRRSGQRGG